MTARESVFLRSFFVGKVTPTKKLYLFILSMHRTTTISIALWDNLAFHVKGEVDIFDLQLQPSVLHWHERIMGFDASYLFAWSYILQFMAHNS